MSDLSPREREILSLIYEGKTNEEIADKLCTSINTVRNQISYIYAKLGVKNRVEAVKIVQTY